MVIPKLSSEDRAAALEKAKEARIKRAEIREKLKSGKLSLKKVLAMKDDPVVGRMKVSTLIETLPGYGKAKSEKIMAELKQHIAGYALPKEIIFRPELPKTLVGKVAYRLLEEEANREADSE